MPLCAYCGKSAESEGHERKAIGGDGPFANLILQTCPAVPGYPGYAIAPRVQRPVVFDANCPFDHEIEFYNVLVVGDKAKATHEATHVNVGSRGEVLGVATKPIGQQPIVTVTSGAVWTGESARQMMDSGKPLIPMTFPDLAGVPKPDVEWQREVMGRWVGPPKSAEQIDYERRERIALLWSSTPAPTEVFQLRDSRGVMRDVSREEYDRANAASAAKTERADRLFLAAQREDGQAASAISMHEVAVASRRWSAQLRAKVEQQKKRDAEAARYTPYWSPEEQSGGDL